MAIDQLKHTLAIGNWGSPCGCVIFVLLDPSEFSMLMNNGSLCKTTVYCSIVGPS